MLEVCGDTPTSNPTSSPRLRSRWKQDIDALFHIFDLDGNGTISYNEMYTVLNKRREYKKDLLATVEPPPPWPELPSRLQHRRAELLELYRMYARMIRLRGS